MMRRAMNGLQQTLEIRCRHPELPALLPGGISDAIEREATRQKNPLLPQPDRLE